MFFPSHNPAHVVLPRLITYRERQLVLLSCHGVFSYTHLLRNDGIPSHRNCANYEGNMVQMGYNASSWKLIQSNLFVCKDTFASFFLAAGVARLF